MCGMLLISNDQITKIIVALLSASGDKNQKHYYCDKVFATARNKYINEERSPIHSVIISTKKKR
jgi:hypothetical protein